MSAQGRHSIRWLLAAAGLLATTTASAAVLWSNGAEVWGRANSNEINTSVGYSVVYDDFTVPDTVTSWQISSVWSVNTFSGEVHTPTTQAQWEIRSGAAEGMGGSLLAGGIAAATETLSSTLGSSSSYLIKVDGLNLILTPGTYWLSVTPIGYGNSAYNQWFVQGTFGDDSVGVLPENDGNAFWTAMSFGSPFFRSLGSDDFAMGVEGRALEGSAVPEPSSLALLALSALLLTGFRRGSRA